MKKQSYYYRVVDYRVIDGDTVDVHIDLGFSIIINKRIRFANIDTEELRGGTDATKLRARHAKDVVDLYFQHCNEIILETYMDATGKYGRVLGEFHCTNHKGEQLVLSEALKNFGFEKGGVTTIDMDYSSKCLEELFNYYSLERDVEEK